MALQLAGLHAQVLWGQYDPTLMNRYDNLNEYLHPRIINSVKNRTEDEWRKEIANAHEVKKIIEKCRVENNVTTINKFIMSH